MLPLSFPQSFVPPLSLNFPLNVSCVAAICWEFLILADSAGHDVSGYASSNARSIKIILETVVVMKIKITCSWINVKDVRARQNAYLVLTARMVNAAVKHVIFLLKLRELATETCVGWEVLGR